MDKLYQIEYKDKHNTNGTYHETVLAEDEAAALKKFIHYVDRFGIQLDGDPRVSHIFVDTHIALSDGTYGPRPRSPIEYDALLSKPSAGCCDFFATGGTGFKDS
jgi:hypothetical protein